ncbi:phosphoribosylaminoimidazolecarboxamide formyltransferase [Megalodesulfovibrio gigas]|uniref:Putative phosphoribosylaminoimidazolecarboxamide formyltransferase n=1 Tax=Megalodesulfovibrio gigas (strain ATCC 19364 / DSM 1382 / NCIMB 9332 / VKM B-1759) TaxID=1121448 RepID=T2G9Y5_MEGG1|nr:phosphoribosylaminoimidazolecarboxamide formyltransferase [Megalodesulfovibrio gigas]AGW13073.1 putative phosphoribosylaminoimidazolecarboxamide formyltransferase [Megalodesulfovibrio gigas DSM 1382 = ATCC 19364]
MQDLKRMYKNLEKDIFPQKLTLRLGDQELVYAKRTWVIDNQEKGLRYGENPGQSAALYACIAGALQPGGVDLRCQAAGLVSSLTEAQMLQAGKHPGKTNLTDVDNGVNILQYLTAKPAAVILKHNNPCGAAWSDAGLADAVAKAFWGDRIAAFGGAVVVNRPLDKAAAEFLAAQYFEVVAAPAFEPGAVEVLKSRKNLRILELPGLAELDRLAGQPVLDIKCLSDGGIIVQTSFLNRIRSVDDFLPATAEKDGVTILARKPSRQEADDLLFAWAVEAGVSSNSVLFAKDGATVAIGAGEQDRVGCVQLAVFKAYTKYADVLAFREQGCSFYELKAKARAEASFQEILDDIQARAQAAKGGLTGSAMVSDGFFPFRDGVDAALEHGVAAIAQPGGSMRDFEVIQAVNEAKPQAAMVFTGQRSFKH